MGLLQKNNISPSSLGNDGLLVRFILHRAPQMAALNVSQTFAVDLGTVSLIYRLFRNTCISPI